MTVTTSCKTPSDKGSLTSGDYPSGISGNACLLFFPCVAAAWWSAWIRKQPPATVATCKNLKAFILKLGFPTKTITCHC